MKKILALILTFSISLGFAFAQEANVEESESKGKYLGFIKDMRAGAFFNFEPALGELNEFVFSTIGGGASFEAGIPLPIFSKNTVVHDIFENFGASFRMAFDGGLMRQTSVESIFSMRYMLGVFTQIPLPGKMFSIVPEIGYGVVLNLPKVNGAGSKYVESVYVDQILQVGAGVRFKHPDMLKGNLELELTPTYSFSPEFGSSVHFLGFRFGALYKFADRGSSVSAKEASTSLKNKNTKMTPKLIAKKEGLDKRAQKLKLEFEELSQDAADNNLKTLATKYKGFENQVDKIIEELASVDSEESLAAIEERLNQLNGQIGNLEETEAAAELELDMAVTEVVAKTGHAALIHHPDGSFTIAIPPLTFEANSTGLVISTENKQSLDTLIEVLKTDDRIADKTISVYGYINPSSRTETWTAEEKRLAKRRAEAVAKYLTENGSKQRIDTHSGSGYTSNAVFNRRVEFIVHK